MIWMKKISVGRKLSKKWLKKDILSLPRSPILANWGLVSLLLVDLLGIFVHIVPFKTIAGLLLHALNHLCFKINLKVEFHSQIHWKRTKFSQKRSGRDLKLSASTRNMSNIGQIQRMLLCNERMCSKFHRKQNTNALFHDKWTMYQKYSFFDCLVKFSRRPPW